MGSGGKPDSSLFWTHPTVRLQIWESLFEVDGHTRDEDIEVPGVTETSDQDTPDCRRGEHL